ncbi:drebrin isoform X6 [Artibeus jamaicensis]|uniref:drebrin isoform X6 n=1 Tax=Artibeus jamaicensis TaxID=9417 RepID=UPI00235B1120|nr:drebrin isoform X6 [Artibeus jamaicensis]
MAGVSFSGHRLELLAAYEEVIREESAADWALYTYEDGSDDLKLAASGDGGLQELSGHFENQKVMYGFCSVKDSQAALPKYVLINWVGEDVPDARKCACASHVAKVAEFFQGVDVIVNASSVEDIDAGAIGQRLSNGLARLSSPVLHRLRLREDENAEPVVSGTTYQKTDAAVEMKRINREQFWEQAKKEEELRKEEERKKALDERLRFEQERMEQERQEQEERERRYREREQQIEEHRRKQQTLEAEEAKRRLKEQSIFGDHQDEEEEAQMKKSESEVEEAAAIIAQRPDNPREFFKQQERVASASAGSCDMPSPFGHRPGRPYCPFIKASDSGPSSSSSSSSSPPRTPFPYITCHRTPNLSSSLPCSHLDSHRRMAPTPIPTRSPSDSSTASTPVSEQIERALDEVTSSQPPPLPPPPPPTQAPEQAILATPLEPAIADPTAADTLAAAAVETNVAAADTAVANTATPAAASLIDLWPDHGDGTSAPQAEPRSPTAPSGAEVTLAEVTLLDERAQEPVPPTGEVCANLLNFDELPEPPATFCDPEAEVEGEPLAAPQAPALPSTLEELDQEPELEPELEPEQEPEPEPHLLTNGETTQKEGTQASEGYFSQSQEEEFTQSEDLCAKAPPPVFYNKPPEIDITCWDADPVPEEEEGFEGDD